MKIINSELHINADSIMSGNDVVRHDERKHCILKSVLITQNVCLIYAGNIEPASKLIKQIYDTGKFSFRHLINMVLSNHLKYDKSTDYIIAAYLNNTPEIVEIKNGSLSKGNQTSWIGSKRAFEAFQEIFHTKRDKSTNIIKTFRTSFEQVLGNDKIPEVGSFQFTLHSIQKEGRMLLNYQPSVNMHVIFSNELERFGFVDSINSTKTNGGFSVTYIPAVQMHNTGVGLHFGHVDFGLLFSPRLFGIYPRTFYNVSGIDFAESAMKAGVVLGGLVFDAENNTMRKV